MGFEGRGLGWKGSIQAPGTICAMGLGGRGAWMERMIPKVKYSKCIPKWYQGWQKYHQNCPKWSPWRSPGHPWGALGHQNALKWSPWGSLGHPWGGLGASWEQQGLAILIFDRFWGTFWHIFGAKMETKADKNDAIK